MASDGSNGAIITWQDFHPVSTYSDIYAQRVDSNGDILWTNNGAAICTEGRLCCPAMESDNIGGAIITWLDKRHGNLDIYAQRVDEDGNTLWALSGVAICITATIQYEHDITSDGAEGAIVTWEDNPIGDADIYAQRVDSSGAVSWAADGVAICTAPA
ncbi:MAG: hypothetical protein ACE5KJ_03245, partial [Candidatus Zixiibacteriota bacterium]